jgi:hypothetical protein
MRREQIKKWIVYLKCDKRVELWTVTHNKNRLKGVDSCPQPKYVCEISCQWRIIIIFGRKLWCEGFEIEVVKWRRKGRWRMNQIHDSITKTLIEVPICLKSWSLFKITKEFQEESKYQLWTFWETKKHKWWIITNIWRDFSHTKTWHLKCVINNRPNSDFVHSSRKVSCCWRINNWWCCEIRQVGVFCT